MTLQDKVTIQVVERMQETGERDRLKEYLRRALEDSKWRDGLRKQCRAVLKDSPDSCKTVDQLVEKVKDFGKNSVPQDVYAKLLTEVAEIVRNHCSQS